MSRRSQSGLLLGGVIGALALLALHALPAPEWSPVPGPDAAQAASCGQSGLAPARRRLGYMRRSIQCLVNRARRRHGLSRVRERRELRRAATAHSVDMVTRRFFSHIGSNGSSPLGRLRGAGYLAGAVSYRYGENIAAGCARLGSPRAIFRAWMRSPGHRSVILTGSFRHLGVGIARGYPFGGGRRCATYTLDLASRG